MDFEYPNKFVKMIAEKTKKQTRNFLFAYELLDWPK